MSNPFNDDSIEEYRQWNAEHEIRIPANESYRADVIVVVWEPDDCGRIRMNVTTTDGDIPPEQRTGAIVCLLPEEARRLSDLLLAAAAEESSA